MPWVVIQYMFYRAARNKAKLRTLSTVRLFWRRDPEEVNYMGPAVEKFLGDMKGLKEVHLWKGSALNTAIDGFLKEEGKALKVVQVTRKDLW